MDIHRTINRNPLWNGAQEVISAGPGEEGYLLPILTSTATALRELHSNGYVHNQLLPDNIQVVEHNGKRIGVLDNFAKACAVETTQSFTTAQVNEVQWASELFLLANSHISYNTCIPKTVGIHASYMKDYSGNPMLLYDLQSDIDRYQTLDQEVI